ncbi:MAG TPA: ABC transporter permease [Phycisphaerales bacterium]|nr:ABC transporter permease [Phycisphaerales bacterium]
MITQTLAIFLDAYRELNSKKLFWITLALSGLVVLIYAAIGIDAKGVSFLWFRLPFIPTTSEEIPPELLYKSIFMRLGLGLWLTWIATILALISTAGIIPDMIAGGSIEMLLSRPISRPRLLLTKYASGLLFVTLQVGVFTAACFLVIGVRGRAWEPGLFLAVPLVVCFFSYLFCFCALVGVLTRSTIASLLLTLLFWFVLFILNAADATLLMFQSRAELQRDAYVERLESARDAAGKIIAARREQAGEPVPEGFVPSDEEMRGVMPWIGMVFDNRDDAEESLAKLRPWVRAVYLGKTFLPKTGETIALLERSLMSAADLERMAETDDEEQTAVDEDTGEAAISDSELSVRLEQELRDRPVWWVLGTSLAFEAVILALAVGSFSRKDL